MKYLRYTPKQTAIVLIGFTLIVVITTLGASALLNAATSKPLPRVWTTVQIGSHPTCTVHLIRHQDYRAKCKDGWTRIFGECYTEDSEMCVWDAQRMGNRIGKSSVNLMGDSFYRMTPRTR